jgi:hypothetical protein
MTPGRLIDGVRSIGAHAKKHHPLGLAYSPTANAAGTRVFVVCGWLGCPQRLEVDAAVWKAEAARRARASEGVQVWHARGDRLVPVAPDADGLVPPAPRHPTTGRATKEMHRREMHGA